MTLAIFDLDNTLIAGDSDFLWGQFLAKKGIVNKAYYEEENRRFYEQYNAGTLDIEAFLAFSLKPLSENEMTQLEAWRIEFIQQEIRPILLPKAFKLIKSHAEQGDTLMIITATNRFVTEPIAKMLGIKHLLATDPEVVDNRYTGKVMGEPCFKEGKVKQLRSWLYSNSETLDGSWFYSDSHNDLPLLKIVMHPVAVNADDRLQAHAKKNNWQILSLR